MSTPVKLEMIDVSIRENRSLELCKGDIPGARPVHHTVMAGSAIDFAPNAGYYHILILIEGEVEFTCAGEKYRYDKRVTFVPGAEQPLTAAALTDVQLLEVQWDIFPEDAAMLEEYKTQFPVKVLYKDSIQYIDPNKS